MHPVRKQRLYMVLFVVIAYVLGYQFFRRVGGYDRATALFAGMPGGLHYTRSSRISCSISEAFQMSSKRFR